jgi:TetR/AcrR family transcriptional repressor of bet genes
MAVNEQPKAPIGRQEQKEMTRRRLIEATKESIATDGFSGTTLAKVANSIGLSQGVVNFHFQSKEQLLQETLRQLANEVLALCTDAVSDESDTAANRLVALIRCILSPQLTNHLDASIWHGYWGEAKSRHAYIEICAPLDQQLDDMFLNLCEQIKREGHYDNINSRHVVDGVTALIGGFDLQVLLEPQNFHWEKALQTCIDLLSAYFPKHFKAIK